MVGTQAMESWEITTIHLSQEDDYSSLSLSILEIREHNHAYQWFAESFLQKKSTGTLELMVETLIK